MRGQRMIFYLKALGAGAILLAALILGRGYTAYTRRVGAEYSAILDLLAHMKEQLDCYLTAGAQMLSGFSSERLSELGFFEVEGDALTRFTKIKGALGIDRETVDALERFFREFGSGYREVESERLAAISSLVRRRGEGYCAEAPREAKLVRSLLVAGALGLVILFI